MPFCVLSEAVAVRAITGTVGYLELIRTRVYQRVDDACNVSKIHQKQVLIHDGHRNRYHQQKSYEGQIGIAHLSRRDPNCMYAGRKSWPH